jgi:hypothetical protein
MDERIEKAFGVANYMATLSNQRRVILEEYSQDLIYYVNGATFKITYELVSFVIVLVDMGNTTDVVLVDSNNFPVLIPNLEEFLTDLISQYLKTVNTYADKFNEIKVKRKIADIVDL